MKYRHLPRTNLELSEVGFGLWTVSTNWWGHIEESDGIRLLEKAFDLGITCFDTADTILGVLGALGATLEGCRFDEERCAAALSGGHLLATELADYLAKKGVPFRRAHEIAGGLVRTAERRGVDVSELGLDQLQEAAPEFGADTLKALSIAAALESKGTFGGTAPARVRRSLAAWKRRLNT